MSKIITNLEELSYISTLVSEGESYKEIVSDLKKTIKKEHLKSLSAPAIGYDRRIFCINYDLEIKTYINPVITKATGITLVEESCSSIPDKHFLIPRNEELDVMYTNTKGEIQSKHLTGLASFVFQHEMDHLNGVNLTDLGLELDDDYKDASDEEKEQIVDMYLKSLNVRLEGFKEEVKEDKNLAALEEQVRFYESLARGEVQLEETKRDVNNESDTNSQN